MFSDTSDLLELEGSFFWYMLNFHMINYLFKKLRILGKYLANTTLNAASLASRGTFLRWCRK